MEPLELFRALKKAIAIDVVKKSAEIKSWRQRHEMGAQGHEDTKRKLRTGHEMNILTSCS
jgi:hypothetical protein